MSVQNKDLSGFENEIIFSFCWLWAVKNASCIPELEHWGGIWPHPRDPCQSYFPTSDLHDFQFSFLQFLQMADIFQPPGSCNFLLNWSQFLKSNFLFFKGMRVASTRMRPSDSTACCLLLLLSLFDLIFSQFVPTESW